MILGRTYTYMMESQFGRVADWERKHPGKKAYGHQGASGKEASGVRDAQAPERRVARTFLGLSIVLRRLALGLGPIGALGLGRLARETEPGPMVPTQDKDFSRIFCCST